MTNPKTIAIIGGGPAGLMAADALLSSGQFGTDDLAVTVYDSMPSVGRKLLMAGKSGLNCTHSEPEDSFVQRYSGPDLTLLVSAMTQFGGRDVVALFDHYGQETFVGSSGRIFPTAMKASPFLRAWLGDLAQRGLTIETRHKMTAIAQSDDQPKTLPTALTFDTPDGPKQITADAVVLACGGGSWARLGSDGSWQGVLAQNGIHSSAFTPSNGGFLVAWDADMIRNYAGRPVKAVTVSAGGVDVKGEFVITKGGVEGSAIYRLSRALVAGHDLKVDLLPRKSLQEIKSILNAPRGKMSLVNLLRKKLKLVGVKLALIKACTPKETMQDMTALARAIKSLPVPITGPTPLDQAISTGGGLPLSSLDHNWMIKGHDGLFAAGEMCDWDAPTGGYLLTACWATGQAAGRGVAHWLKSQQAETTD